MEKKTNSFREWFYIMWINWYIQLFVMALVGQIFEFAYLQDVMGAIDQAINDGFPANLLTITGFLLPVIIMITIGYKGFYQKWDDYKQGKSR